MKNTNALSVKEFNSLMEKMKKRLSVSNHSQQTVIKYLHSVEYLFFKSAGFLKFGRFVVRKLIKNF